jgi:hypothetical protein
MSVTRLLLLLLLLLLCCCVHESVQQAAMSSSAVKDCNKEPGARASACFRRNDSLLAAGSCGANGTCKSDGVCRCELENFFFSFTIFFLVFDMRNAYGSGGRGFRGQTCAIGPPALQPDFKVPAQLDETRPEAFFSVNPGEFSTDTVITVDVVGSNPLPINVFISIGVMPTAATHQFLISDSTLVEFLIPTTDLAQAAKPDAEPRLFIVVQAANSAKDKVPFSIKTSGLGSLVAGLPDWALYLIIVLGSLCCLVVIALIAFGVFKLVAGGGGGGGGKPKKQKPQQQQQQQQQMMMMQQGGNWGGGHMTADYPSAQQIQMQPQQPQLQGQAQQQMQQGYAQQAYGNTMQPQGTYPSDFQAQQQQQQQAYGGSAIGYPSGTQSTEFGRGQSSSFVDANSYHEDPTMQPLW